MVGVTRRLLSLQRSRQVSDNFNGAESPLVRLVALLDLSETCLLSTPADSFKMHRFDTPHRYIQG